MDLISLQVISVSFVPLKSTWLVICRKCQHKASCYFLAHPLDTNFFSAGIQAFAMVGKMLNDCGDYTKV
jgi:hypothetical protein